MLALSGLGENELRKLASRLHKELEKAQDDISSLLTQAREEGVKEGVEQARGELTASLLAATDSIHAAIEQFGASIDDRFDTVVRDCASLLLVGVEFLAGRAIDASPIETVSSAIAELLGQMHQFHDIDVEVHPSLVEPLQRKFSLIPAVGRNAYRLEIIGNADLVPGDAQLSWGTGGLKIDLETRRAALLDTLAILLPDKPDSLAED
jgi:flagellar assembly protein FliH